MLILAADLHIRPTGRRLEDFREFLQWISRTNYDVAFLGDVLELWIGVPGYENALTQEFLLWCSDESHRRKVYLVEGNHEFFVAKYHGGNFTAVATDELWVEDGRLLLLHGDSCQGDPAHSRFRWWSKSCLARLLLRWMPLAPRIVRWLKGRFEAAAKRRRKIFPQIPVSGYASTVFAANDNLPQLIVAGHFHRSFQEFRRDGRGMVILPAWCDQQEIGLWDGQDGQLKVLPWRRVAKEK